MLQLCSMSSTASQSSNSGCVGGVPLRPKSNTVGTSGLAHVPHPDVIDRDARRQRMTRVGKPLGKGGTSPGAGRRETACRRCDSDSLPASSLRRAAACRLRWALRSLREQSQVPSWRRPAFFSASAFLSAAACNSASSARLSSSSARAAARTRSDFAAVDGELLVASESCARVASDGAAARWRAQVNRPICGSLALRSRRAELRRSVLLFRRWSRRAALVRLAAASRSVSNWPRASPEEQPHRRASVPPATAGVQTQQTRLRHRMRSIPNGRAVDSGSAAAGMRSSVRHRRTC